MGAVDEYQKNARQCVELALSAQPMDAPILLRLAQSWQKLADQTALAEANAALMAARLEAAE